MSDEPVFASDGLLARASGPWAEDKLYYVRRYVHAMSTGMKNSWTRRAYVDLMSGPGRCIVPQTGQEFEGSLLIALRARDPFDVVILVEKNADNMAALSARVTDDGLRPDPLLIEDDCNQPRVINRIRAETHGALTLVLIDLLGFNVPFDTIRRLTAAPAAIDLIITFPEMNLTRNAILAAVNDDSSRWSAFFGTDRWRAHVIRWIQKGDRRGESVKWGLTRIYQAQLKSIGYDSWLVREPMRSWTNAPLYRPLFASRSEHGLKLWRGISAKEHTGIARLF